MTASQDFNNAIVTYSSDAKSMFETGHAALPAPSVPASPPEERQKQARGMLGAGFSQLGQAAKMESEQAGRLGYAAVVKLMQSTADTAAVICKRIDSIVGTSGPFPAIDSTEINNLTQALRALAELSPAEVWAPPAPSSSE